MPIFEYKCSSCGYKFELFRSLTSSEPVACPNCGANETIKLFSTFAAANSGDHPGSLSSSGSGCSVGSFT